MNTVALILIVAYLISIVVRRRRIDRQFLRMKGERL